MRNTTMTQLFSTRNKVAVSFARTKDDMVNLYDHIKFLYQQVALLQKECERLRVLAQHQEKSTSVILVASKKGKRVHNSTCPFMKNVRREQRVMFSNIDEAKIKGYKNCSCVKG
ncbi:hypothetical protein HYV86_06190 [Candidatus Woesearchaeota archaeon]|nr:hypothetical protein [Candidatus Woesearchaeota archaeon]